ncbi:PAS domain S-box protein [Sphingomonas sp.]|uniref:PAS domain-containing sensor histidine kinase n=1 Tax=Sphingomonas sp. TaxID=28214 RepID=UPI001B19D63B|nr:PAS domain S-box protein [Sphingomonas sp.]MBO9713459.1 PAS domain S-box protein [Sphingomonas sp.]
MASEAARFGAVALLCLAAVAIGHWATAAALALFFAVVAAVVARREGPPLRQARAQLIAAEARYRAVFEHSMVGMVRATQEGIYLEVNDRFCAILGAPREAIVGHSFKEFTHSEHVATDSAAVREMVSGERRNYLNEKRIVRPDGSVVWVMVASMLVRDDAGRPDHFIGVYEDITDRKRAEAALRESEARFRLAQEAAGVGVWEIDLDRDVAIHSPVSQRMNVLPERADGVYTRRELEAHFGPELSAEVAANLADAIQGSSYDSTYRLNPPDGITRWVRAIGRHEPDEDGGRGRLIGVSVDVTAFHESQTELIAAHEKLLGVSRLSSMGAMASTLAHELNQPLAAATNYAEVARAMLRMRRDPADAKLLEMLDQTVAQALRAGDIIRKMRSFTVSGEIEPEREDVEALVANACTAIEERSRAAGVTIITDVDPGVGEVMVERIQIEQVLANLLRNAIEAMQGCEDPHITVSARRRPHDVLLCVADTGPGIPPEVLGHVFEPFRSSKENGLGLGLSICRTIVEAHGGRLWAESPPGSGAIFHLALPSAREEAAA